MFFTKSETDLGKSKHDAEHRVVCDWLRNIDKKLTRIDQHIHLLMDTQIEGQFSSPSGEQDVK